MRWPALLVTLSLLTRQASAQETEPQPVPSAEPAPPPLAKPSIVVDAKDDRGRDIPDVTVFIDDQPVAYTLGEGRFELAPGPHTIAVQRNDGPRQRATTTLTLGPGETNRPVHLVFEPAIETVTLEPPMNAPILPRIVAGVGVAAVVTGVVLLLARPSLPTNCSSDTHRCTRLSAQTDAQYAADREDAASNRDLLTAGLATLVSGAGLTAAGVLWYVLEVPKPRTASFAPWLQGGGGGLTVRAAF